MKSHVHNITDRLDTDTLCEQLGVTPRMVRKTRQLRTFPPRWYPVVSAMCRDAGIDCPMEAFNWPLPSAPAE